jgi:hypothetical protein
MSIYGDGRTSPTLYCRLQQLGYATRQYIMILQLSTTFFDKTLSAGFTPEPSNAFRTRFAMSFVARGANARLTDPHANLALRATRRLFCWPRARVGKFHKDKDRDARMPDALSTMNSINTPSFLLSTIIIMSSTVASNKRTAEAASLSDDAPRE